MAYSIYQVRLGINFTDEDDQTTTKIVDVKTGVDDAATLSNAADVVAAYAAVTSAAVTDYMVTFHFSDGALTAGADSEVQARANIVVDLVTDATHKQEYGVIEIPSPVDGLFLAASGEGKNIVDITDGDLGTLVAVYTTGAGQKAYLADRQAVQSTDPIIRGKRFHRASRRG